MKRTIPKLIFIILLFANGEAIGQNLAFGNMLPVERHYIHSTTNGKAYQLIISLPVNYSPADTTHYPVLYFLDGYYSFPLIYSTKFVMEYFTGEIEPTIIVCIVDSLLDKTTWFNSRYTDYTPSSSASGDSMMAAETEIPVRLIKSGGAPAFLNTIRNQIIPYIDQHYRTTTDRGIAGHSLGGLFAGYCLVTVPNLFKRYGLNSPSFWWDNKKLFAMEQSFSEKNKILNAQVFMSVGSLENQVMIPSMTGFADSLKNHHYQGLSLTSTIFDNENHMSVIPAMISRTLRVLYSVKKK